MICDMASMEAFRTNMYQANINACSMTALYAGRNALSVCHCPSVKFLASHCSTWLEPRGSLSENEKDKFCSQAHLLNIEDKNHLGGKLGEVPLTLKRICAAATYPK